MQLVAIREVRGSEVSTCMSRLVSLWQSQQHTQSICKRAGDACLRGERSEGMSWGCRVPCASSGVSFAAGISGMVSRAAHCTCTRPSLLSKRGAGCLPVPAQVIHV